MPLTPPEDTSRWTADIEDMIASDSGIREGLHDEDAIPLMEWGRAQAKRVAARLESDMPDADEEAAGNEAGVLIRLMTTISRAAVHRHAQGDEWLAKVFSRLNKTSQRVYGENAPVMSDEEIATWIAGHAARSDGDVLRDLMARFSPPEAGTPASTAPEPVEPESPPQPHDHAPAAPLSAILDSLLGAKPDSASESSTPAEPPDHLPGRTPTALPGRSSLPGNHHDTDPSSPSRTGDEYDQE